MFQTMGVKSNAHDKYYVSSDGGYSFAEFMIGNLDDITNLDNIGSILSNLGNLITNKSIENILGNLINFAGNSITIANYVQMYVKITNLKKSIVDNINNNIRPNPDLTELHNLEKQLWTKGIYQSSNQLFYAYSFSTKNSLLSNIDNIMFAIYHF